MDNQIFDEDLAIKAVIEAAALDYSISDFKNPYSWKRGGYTKANHSFVSHAKKGDYKSWAEARTPPAGYLCHRCRSPGHLIQHCPTNGDPEFDFKRMKPATRVPKSTLAASEDGFYQKPNGRAAVLQPNEAEFEKMVDCLPTKHAVDIPPELHCPLCKRAMQESVLTSKCCFKSYCDKCIRDYTISRNICVCGEPSKANDLIPNITVRMTIDRYLSSSNAGSSSRDVGASVQINEVQSTNNSAKPKGTKSSNKSDENPKDEEKIEIKAMKVLEMTTESVRKSSAGKKLKKRKLPEAAVNAEMQPVNCMMPYQSFDYYSCMANYGVGNYDVAYLGMPLQNQIRTNCYMMPTVFQSDEPLKDWIATNGGNSAKAKLTSHFFVILYIFVYNFFIFVYSFACIFILILLEKNMPNISRNLKWNSKYLCSFCGVLGVLYNGVEGIILFVF